MRKIVALVQEASRERADPAGREIKVAVASAAPYKGRHVHAITRDWKESDYLQLSSLHVCNLPPD
jgi:hypothetical protein